MKEERSRASHHVEDLSVLMRRGALSAADQQAFTDALAASATLSNAHQVGLDFDRVTTLRPGDDALIAEVVARAIRGQRRTLRARFRLGASLLAATLALAGTATAWWQRTRAPVNVAAPLPSALDIGNGTPSRAAPAAVRSEPLPSVPSAAPLAVANDSARGALPSTNPSAGRASETSGSGPTPRAFDSAEGLFREANAARRAGETSVARALYLRLEHDFPASEEAALAHVSLGNLLLVMGRAAEAEQQFAAYAGGSSGLAQEALVGRAQSLAALGKTAQERGVWEWLLRDYPTSVYAARARQRLAQLAHSQEGSD